MYIYLYAVDGTGVGDETDDTTWKAGSDPWTVFAQKFQGGASCNQNSFAWPPGESYGSVGTLCEERSLL